MLWVRRHTSIFSGRFLDATSFVFSILAQFHVHSLPDTRTDTPPMSLPAASFLCFVMRRTMWSRRDWTGWERYRNALARATVSASSPAKPRNINLYSHPYPRAILSWQAANHWNNRTVTINIDIFFSLRIFCDQSLNLIRQ